MKRFLVASILALGLMAWSPNEASAWSKFNFNIGLNISYEAADTNFLWGLFRSGPHPFAGQPGYFEGQNGGHGGYTPDVTPGSQPAPQQYYQQMPHAGSPGSQFATQPVGYSTQQQQ